jgi:flagellar L-ring protein FlgH
MDCKSIAVLVLAGALMPGIASAGPKKPKTAALPSGAPAGMASDNYDELFIRYLESARTVRPGSAASIGWMAGLNADLRARELNDLVTVQVVESIVGTGTADSSLDKKSNGKAAVSGLFGLESKLPSAIDPSNLLSTTSNTGFKGSGTTTRAGTLSAVMTTRVTEVLPNGDLVLEGVREIDINGDRQIVVLTGVVRPNSISKANVVPSSAIGQLRIRYFGRGLIKDNLQPGWLIRVLNKLF